MNFYHFKAAFLIFIFFVSCKPETTRSYEHELGVISNPRMYHKIIEDTPEKKLVDLETFIPGITLDIRYAGRNNFTGSKIYKKAKAYLRLPAAKALKNIEESLNKQGLGLKVFDAYRPYSATLKFYEVFPDTNFVAAPWHGSRHNRGCAVDVTLISLETGEELPMPTHFDDFSEKAGHTFMDLPDTVLKNRKLLAETMTNNGFSMYPYEWWHYDFNQWKLYELLNLPFEELK
jgi:zinc D-Ala-D-Ala dipeptidase